MDDEGAQVDCSIGECVAVGVPIEAAFGQGVRL